VVRPRLAHALPAALLLAAAGTQHACSPNGPRHDATLTLRTRSALVVLSASGHVRASLTARGPNVPDLHVGTPAPQLCLGRETLDDVLLDLSQARDATPRAVGSLAGHAIEAGGRGTGRLAGIAKSLRLEVYDDLPGLALVQATYTNAGTRSLTIDRVIAQRWQLAAPAGTPRLWSFHGSSEQAREEAVLPLTPGFARANAMGAMTATGRGGGLPLVAFWSRQAGAALGHAETTPRILSLPVRVDDTGHVAVAIEVPVQATLAPGASLTTPWLFVSAFTGDYYDAIRGWIQALSSRGLVLPAYASGAYEPSWCGWGFGLRFTPQQMIGALPAVTRLGFKWATLDEGVFSNQGDGVPRAEFGVGGVRRIVQAYHARGLRLQLWWLPLAVEDGGLRPRGRQRRVAGVVREHPEWLILDASGRPAHTFGGFALLCPALPEVREHHVKLTRRFLGEWGFDGLKIDKVFSVPPCYNPAHGHRAPSESVERMGEIFRAIYETAHSLRPDALVQICPCASLPNLAWLPYLDQPVTSDPDGSAQVRWRTKVLKAIYGPRAPVYADHVELTTSRWEGARQLTFGSDFASALGVGAVPGTRFVWPETPGFEDVSLTPERERHFRRWLDLYRSQGLAAGEFLSLYVHGFDLPEGYAIEKDGRLYYAFFTEQAQPDFRGTIELRGLAARHSYRVRDYEREQDLGTVSGPTARVHVEFRRRLLLVATPE
jgi:alpha-galactosidase